MEQLALNYPIIPRFIGGRIGMVGVLHTWTRDLMYHPHVHYIVTGSGQAAFKYLAPYIFRVAISNNRILELEDGQVTFNYKESATDRIKFRTIPAEEFIRRFLQLRTTRHTNS